MSVDSNEPDWIIEQTKARKRRELLRQREDMEARLEKIRAKEKAQREKYLKGDQTFKKRKTNVEKRAKRAMKSNLFWTIMTVIASRMGSKTDRRSVGIRW
jgi:hypothetical protein